LTATAAMAADSVGERGRSADKKNSLKNVHFGVMPRLIDPKDPLSKSDFAMKLADKNAKTNWKMPMRGDQVEDLPSIFPDFLEAVGAGSQRRVPGAWLQYRT